MKYAAAKFVPRLLTEDQKTSHINVCHDLKDQFRNDPHILFKDVIGDES